MARSKFKLFLETLKQSKLTVEPKAIEDAEKELELLKSQKHSTENEMLLKDVSLILRLSKDRASINKAKKQVQRLEDSMPVYEALLKKILKPRRSKKSANQRIFSANTHNDDHENTDYIHELLERSKKASAALTHDNPDITDLSDPNRPTKTAERFSELYDNEWTDAFEEVFQSGQADEMKIISVLLKATKSAYTYCTEEARKLNWEKTAKAVDYRSNYRKEDAQREIPKIQKGFLKVYRTSDLVKPGPKEKDFVNICIELCWWMCIQERPVYMCNVDDEELFNRDLYRAYTQSGPKLEYIVWPALKLYKDGPLLYRGVAQFK